jgi:hypothetical protein
MCVCMGEEGGGAKNAVTVFFYSFSFPCLLCVYILRDLGFLIYIYIYIYIYSTRMMRHATGKDRCVISLCFPPREIFFLSLTERPFLDCSFALERSKLKWLGRALIFEFPPWRLCASSPSPPRCLSFLCACAAWVLVACLLCAQQILWMCVNGAEKKWSCYMLCVCIFVGWGGL